MLLQKINILLSRKLRDCMRKDDNVVFPAIAIALTLPGELWKAAALLGKGDIDRLPQDTTFLRFLYGDMVNSSKRIVMSLHASSPKTRPFTISVEIHLFANGCKEPFRILRFGVGGGVMWYKEG